MAIADALLQPFVWGAGGQAMTPEAIARQREIATALRNQAGDTSPVGHWSQGAARVVNALGGVLADRRANSASSANADTSRDIVTRMLSGTAGQQFPAAPGAPTASDYADTRVKTAFGDNAGEIRQGLIDRGMSPQIADAFVMNFQDESGLNPGINEAAPIVPGSRGGFGLAQWTGPRRKALEAFAAQRGTPVSDTGTQLDFLMSELQGPEAKAWQAIQSAPTTGGAAAAIVNNFLRPAEQHRASRERRYMANTDPVQVASLDPSMGMADDLVQRPGMAVPGAAETIPNAPASLAGLNPAEVATPLANGGAPAPALPDPRTIQDMPVAGTPASQQVAQALTGSDLSQIPVTAGGNAGVYQPGQGGGINPAIIEALSSPYVDDQTKRIAGMLLGQQMEQQQQANDPMRALQLEKAQLELQQMREPQAQPLINAGGGAIYNPNTGEWLTSPNGGQIEQPSRVREYEYARQQGFPGSFNDWLASQKGGMSLSVDPATGAVSFQQGGNIKPLTEGQSKDATFATRAEGALPLIDKFGGALTSLPESAAGALPGGVGNYMQSPEYQQAQQAGTEFLQAILRKDTGAAITPQETAEYGKVYLPRPGDSTAVLEQKRVSRTRALEALKAGMTPQAILAQEKALKNTNDAAKKPATVIDGYTIEEVE